MVRIGKGITSFFILLSVAGLLAGMGLLGHGYFQFVNNSDAEQDQLEFTAEKRVLFISSYSANFENYVRQKAGILSVFNRHGIAYDIEFMDMKNFNTPEQAALFYQMMRYKISHHSPYDAVIVSDDPALEFALEHQEELFPGLPVVFLGINSQELAVRAARNPYMAGSFEEMYFPGIMALSKSLFPELSKYAVIYDYSSSAGQGIKAQYDRDKLLFPDDAFLEINTSALTREQLVQELRRVPDDCMVILLGAYEDADGYSYSSSEMSELILSNITVPAFSMAVASVSVGFLGGINVNMEGAGAHAAQTVVDVLFGGRNLADTATYDDIPGLYIFNYQQMKRFGVSPSRLPAGAIIVNRGPTYLERYGVTFFPFLIILCSLAVLLLVMVRYALGIRSAHNALQFSALHDQLTGLPNRALVTRQLEQALAGSAPFAIVVVDVDDFKVTNNYYTQKAGDAILRELARRLQEAEGLHSPFVARNGGDEFLMIMLGVTLEAHSPELYAIRQMISAPFEYGGHTIFLKYSVSVVNRDGAMTTANDYMGAADFTKMESKNLGKNLTVFYTQQMRDAIAVRQQIRKVLEEACENNGFTVLFQPQVETATGRICGYEALVRLKGGQYGPGQFIPVAEESDMIAKMGRLITEQVVRQMAEWRRHGMELRRVSINYSAGQMKDTEYITYLTFLLEKNGISPDLICIEITESLFFGDKKQAHDLFTAFRAAGLHLALDDFGTGYSSISYLTYMPVETIKFDKTLVDTYLVEGKYHIINTLIAFVHNLGMDLTVEGIEERWQYDKIKEFGGDHIQGYFFSKPLDADAVERWTPRLPA